MNVDCPSARFALDEAAPVELALTPFGDRLLVGVVAAAAAHQQTAVHAVGILIAVAASCPQRT
jgi:hypothetical protein